MPSCVGDICRPEAAIELKLCTERFNNKRKGYNKHYHFLAALSVLFSTLCAIFWKEYSLLHRDFPPGNRQTVKRFYKRQTMHESTQWLSTQLKRNPKIWIQIMLFYLIENNENLTQGFEVNLRNLPLEECMFRLHWGNSNKGKECLYARCIFAIILNNKSNLRLLQIVKGYWRAEYGRWCLSRGFIHVNSAEIIN